MALPTWPAVNYKPERPSFQPIKHALDPIETAMEGGNYRLRSRPGDNVGTITQTIRFTQAEHDTFVAWVKDTLVEGTARFTANVYLGTSFQSKVCQFTKGGMPTYTPVSRSRIAATMTIRVMGL